MTGSSGIQSTTPPPADPLDKYVADKRNGFVFYHEYDGRGQPCGGMLFPDPAYRNGGRKCTKCKKQFLPYELHNRKVDGSLCTGRMKFLDIRRNPDGKEEYLSPRTYERECTECHQREEYSEIELVAVFREDIAELDAQNFLRAFGLTPMPAKRDRHNPRVIAIVAAIPKEAQRKPASYAEDLEKHPEMVRAAMPLLRKTRA